MGLNRRDWLTNIAISAAACTTVLGCRESQESREVDGAGDKLLANSGKPLTLFWRDVNRQQLVENDRRWTAIRRFLALPFPESRYRKLHWFRFLGPFFRWAAQTNDDLTWTGLDPENWRVSFDQFRSELLNSETYAAAYKDRLHLRTRHGISFVTAEQQADRDALFADPHRDKILSLFAMSGLSLDHELVVDREVFKVADCVRAACRSCDLQAELPWTTIALCHYLPPTTNWRDKSDAEISFDRIVTRLCETPLESGACFGHHIPFALVTVIRAMQTHGQLIQPQTRQLLDRTLRRCCESLKVSQLKEGSWSANWIEGSPVPDGDSFKARFVSTGHALEWLSYVANDDEELMTRRDLAEEWLCQTLLDLNEFELLSRYNAAAHAVFGLMCLTESLSESQQLKSPRS